MFCMVLFVSLAGCNKPLAPDQLFSIQDGPSGKIISLGDTYRSVTSYTGTKLADGSFLFEEDNTIRDAYANCPGIRVDYFEEKVVAIRLTGESKWQLANGVRAGMSKDEIMKLYADNDMKDIGLQGGILLAYDENKTPIPFREDAPYTFRISFEPATNNNGDPIPGKQVAYMIVIQDNTYGN